MMRNNTFSKVMNFNPDSFLYNVKQHGGCIKSMFRFQIYDDN